jgi:hypothetical protein
MKNDVIHTRHTFWLHIAWIPLFSLLFSAGIHSYDNSYYIFDTHLHGTSQHYNAYYQDFPGCTAACDAVNRSFDHCLNYHNLYTHFMGAENSNIKRALIVEGEFARRSGWTPGECETNPDNPNDYFLLEGNPWDGEGPPDDRKLYWAMYDEESGGECSGMPPEEYEPFIYVSMIGFSIERCTDDQAVLDLLSASWSDSLTFSWVGEKLADPCFKQALTGCPAFGSCEDCTNTPSEEIEHLFSVCGSLGIPISLHLPYMSVEDWSLFLNNGAQCLETDGEENRCVQLINILDLADFYGVGLHKNMASVRLFGGGIQEDVIEAYRYLFEQYPNLTMELFRVNEGYGPADPYQEEDVIETYFNPDTGNLRPEALNLLSLFYDYADRFTVCSHIYPRRDFTPKATFGDRMFGTWVSHGDDAESGGNNHISSVYGTSDNDLFIATEAGTIDHFDGTDWHSLYRSSAVLNDIWGTTERDVFAGGDAGIILKYNGSDFEPFSGPFSSGFHVTALSGFNARNLYAAGTGARIFHFKDTSWVEENLPVEIPPTVTFNDIHCFKDIYGSEWIAACGDFGYITVKYKGKWQVFTVDSMNFQSIWGDTPYNLFSGGSGPDSAGKIYRFTSMSNQWFPVFTQESGSSTITCIWGSTNYDVFCLDENGSIFTLNNIAGDDQWVALHSGNSGLYAGSTCGHREIAAGANGTVLQYTGTRVKLNAWHAYWDAFFEAIRQYAQMLDPPTSGDEQIQMISHGTAERLLGIPPLSR